LENNGGASAIKVNLKAFGLPHCFTGTKEQYFTQKTAKNSVKIGELFKT
jgi:hypothetical protein